MSQSIKFFLLSMKIMFYPLYPCKKPGVVVHMCHFSTVELKTGRLWSSLASQPTLIGETQVPVTEPV